MDRGNLANLAIAQATAAAESGDYAEADEWLRQISAASRPSGLISRTNLGLARGALADGRWADAIRHFEIANRAVLSPAIQERIGLIRRRQHLPLSEAQQDLLGAKVDTAQRLPAQFFAPDLDGVWAAGAYHAWTDSNLPWSRFIRLTKEPVRSAEMQGGMVRLAAAHLGLYVIEETPILGLVDCVVTIPPNPERLAYRGWSFTDEMGRAIERYLAIPFRFGGLALMKSGIELRGLSRAERQRAVRDAFAVPKHHDFTGQAVLVFDDVITSGATMREAARQLRSAGATGVFGVALSHTES